MIWRRRLASILPVGILGAAAVAVTWNIFRAAGMPYNVDISGFFPLTPDAYEARFWPLWNERGGMSAMQFLPALLVEAPFLILGHVLGWGMDLHIKMRILFGFALAGVAMYALVRYHLERHYSAKLGLWTRALLPLVPALFYMLNPWSVHRVFHYFLWLGYGFAPLVLLLFLRLVDAPSWRRAAALALVTAIGTSDPHNPPLFALIVAPFALLHGIALFRRPRAEAIRLGKALGVSLAAYVGLCAFWILPYTYSALTNPGFGPTYVLSDQMLGVLSRNASLMDVLRLAHNYNPRAPLAPPGGMQLVAWNVASLAVPVMAVLGLLFARRLAALGYGILGVAAIVLGMGSAGATAGFYQWLLFGAPWGEGLSWLFRDPYRWGGVQALAYGALLGFFLAQFAFLARRAPSMVRGGARALSPSFALACLAIFVAPSVVGYVGAVYAPVEIPSEYAEANAFLATTPEEDSVVWMPRMLGATTWGGDRTFAYFDATSSARSALGPFRSHTDLYFRFLEDSAKDGADVPALMARAGLQRVVFHNDRDVVRDASKVYTLERAGLSFEARVGESPARVVDQASLAPSNVPAAKYAIHGTRAIAQNFTPAVADPVEMTLLAKRVGDPPPLVVRFLDAAGQIVATRSLDTVEGANGVTVPMRGIHFVEGARYSFQLSAADATGAVPEGARWDLSYYKVETYPGHEMRVSTDGAAWRPLVGNVAFEIQSRATGFVDVLRSPVDAPRVTASDALIASPGNLQALRALSVFPPNATLQQAPVVFTAFDEDARSAFAKSGPWRWVAPLDSSVWEGIVPFLPAQTLVAPFTATSNADGKDGWARGTEDFTYYEWGWRTSLAALKQEAWDFDGNRGLVYTSAPANLTLSVEQAAQGTAAVVLMRVYEHSKGGLLRVHARTTEGEVSVGVVDTRAAVAGFRWREVGVLPEGASALRLEGDGSFLGVNLLAVVPPDVLAQASRASTERFRDTPVTLYVQAEVAPDLAARIVALPGLGRFAEMDRSVALPFDAPATEWYTVWLRTAQGTPAPTASIDGLPVGLAACAAECDGPAPWYALSLGEIASGPHELSLAPARDGERPTIDLLVVTTERAFAAPATGREVTWERIGPTEYRVDLVSAGAVALTLATPYDAGWVARSGEGGTTRSFLANGVTNLFLFPDLAGEPIVLSYEPQAWAQRGVVVGAFALVLVLGVFAAPSFARKRTHAHATQVDREEL